MNFAIPLHRLRETGTLLAFTTQPELSRAYLAGSEAGLCIAAGTAPGDSDFLRDLFETVQSLVRELACLNAATA
jgi:hypothetical protein